MVQTKGSSHQREEDRKLLREGGGGEREGGGREEGGRGGREGGREVRKKGGRSVTSGSHTSWPPAHLVGESWSSECGDELSQSGVLLHS